MAAVFPLSTMELPTVTPEPAFKVAAVLPPSPSVMAPDPAPPAFIETVPALMTKPPVKVLALAPLRVRVLDEDVSFVTEPVPEMMPERVWAAELLYCNVPLLTMLPA